MEKRSASTVVYLIFFFVVFLAFCAFAIDATIVLATRAKLQNATEASALAAASKFSYTTVSTAGDITAAANSAFNMWKYRNLQSAKITSSEVNVVTKQVRIETKMTAPVFFLTLLGVSGVDLSAKACAQSEQLNVRDNYNDNINWVTTAARYVSDIISKGTNLNNTAILQPLGKGSSSSIDSSAGGTGLSMFNLINIDNVGQPLSLGPGGYITIKLPSPIIDKTGPDILVEEYGDVREGYLVFIGLDNDPNDTTDASVATGPYVQYDKTGAGIRWINISCTGKPKVAIEDLGSHMAATQLPVAAQAKFYGPGYFDISGTCSSAGGVSMAKYLRIIDDNEETGYIKNGGTWHPAHVYGEASTTTAGADIDSVSVLNHVKLLPWSGFTP